MNKRDHKIYLKDNQNNLEVSLARKQFDDQPDAMFKDSNIPISDRGNGVRSGKFQLGLECTSSLSDDAAGWVIAYMGLQ